MKHKPMEYISFHEHHLVAKQIHERYFEVRVTVSFNQVCRGLRVGPPVAGQLLRGQGGGQERLRLERAERRLHLLHARKRYKIQSAVCDNDTNSLREASAVCCWGLLHLMAKMLQTYNLLRMPNGDSIEQ